MTDSPTARNERAAEAGLTNVQGWHGQLGQHGHAHHPAAAAAAARHKCVCCAVRVDLVRLMRCRRACAAEMCLLRSVCAEHYTEPFDIALATHLCGAATDAGQALAMRHQAVFVLIPCCLGERSNACHAGLPVYFKKPHGARTIYCMIITFAEASGAPGKIKLQAGGYSGGGGLVAAAGAKPTPATSRPRRLGRPAAAAGSDEVSPGGIGQLQVLPARQRQHACDIAATAARAQAVAATAAPSLRSTRLVPAVRLAAGGERRAGRLPPLGPTVGL